MDFPPSQPPDARWFDACDDVPCGLLSTHADGTIVSVNRTLCVWLGYNAQQLLGQRRLQDLLTMGPPIPQDLRANLFAPLRRGEQQVELGSRSVGLGLYIVQQIVIAHGGAVDVDSSDADGTTFTVSLPGPGALEVRS